MHVGTMSLGLSNSGPVIDNNKQFSAVNTPTRNEQHPAKLSVDETLKRIKQELIKETKITNNFDVKVSYDSSANRVIFTMVDKDSGQVIQEIPGEIVRAITKDFNDQVDAMLIDHKS